MPAASSAAERGLIVTALVPVFRHFQADAIERRDVRLVAEADAAVVVWDGRDPAVRRVLALAWRKGVPVHVLGGPAKKPTTRRVRDEEAPNPRRVAGPSGPTAERKAGGA